MEKLGHRKKDDRCFKALQPKKEFNKDNKIESIKEGFEHFGKVTKMVKEINRSNGADKEFIKKLMKALTSIISLKYKDEMIYGNSFLEISDRKIELFNPKNVKIVNKYLKQYKGEFKNEKN